MRKVFVTLLAILFVISFRSNLKAASLLKEADPQGSSEYAYDEVVVKFKPGTASSQIESFNKHFDTRVTRKRSFADFVTLRVPEGIDAKRFVEKLASDQRVQYAEPNYIAYTQMTPNDPYYSYQWNFQTSEYGGVHAEDAWEVTSGAGVTVAIVDTGIAYENYRQSWWRRYEKAPDLADTCFTSGYDFVNNDSHPNDDRGHGTHVAGTVAQSTNNNLGVAGLAHSTCLMPVKVLNSNGSGSYADIAEGIRYAADNGADVINLSLGGSSGSQVMEDAVSYAFNKGVTVVAAAGNNGQTTLLYPAAYDDYVIAVGATRYDETLAPYSNYGPSLDLVAPGGDLNVDQNGDGYKDGVLQQTFDRNPRDWGYWFYQGTSMATPHVAAAAAMIISNGVSGPDNVRTVLENSAEDLGISGKDNIYGWGLVNIAGALGIEAGSLPTPTSTPTPEPTPTDGPVPTPTPTPTSTPTATPTPVPTATPTPTVEPTPSPTEAPAPTPTPTPNPDKPWWCRWRPSHSYCQ